MADVAYISTHRAQPRIARWASQLHTATQSKHVDAALSTCIALLTALIVTISITNSLVSRADIVFACNQTCVPPVPFNMTGRADERVLANVKVAMAEACDSHESAVLGHQVLVDDEPFAFPIVRLCDKGTVLVDPTVIKYGQFKGQCEETACNTTLRKTRRFPMTVNHSGGKITSVHSLAEACLLQHAIDRLHCEWLEA